MIKKILSEVLILIEIVAPYYLLLSIMMVFLPTGSKSVLLIVSLCKVLQVWKEYVLLGDSGSAGHR